MHRSSFLLPTLGLSVLLFASCQSHMGRVSASLVKLYDIGDPEGLLELELSRDGTIREMEADIKTEAIPEQIRAAALARAPGGVITGGEHEVHGETWTYEVKMRYQNRDWEFVIDKKGNVIEMEKELTRDEAPASVLEAAADAIPGSSFKSVELITIGTERYYHVKRMRGKASYKVVLDPSGKVVSKVREARAEIEIPLK